MKVSSEEMADVAVVPQLTNHGTNFEQQHVQYVYDEIASSMNDTQHKAWPNVKRFLKKFPPGSLIADIGKHVVLMVLNYHVLRLLKLTTSFGSGNYSINHIVKK